MAIGGVMRCKKCGARVKEITLSKGLATIVPFEFEAKKYSANHDPKGHNYRARRRVRGVPRYLHQDILGWRRGVGWTADHIDRNPLNNCLCNLRKASKTIQSQNKRAFGGSKYKGVSWFAPQANWRARIARRGRTYLLGYFKTEIEAAKAYDSAALKLYGPLAFVNSGSR